MQNRNLILWLMACWFVLGMFVLKPARGQGDGPPELPTAVPAGQSEQVPLQTLAAGLTIFVLAIFVGIEVITKVPPTLHTPLMSGSNAISGITVVGAIFVTGQSSGATAVFGMIAVALAMINVVGGFWVTHRMLGMFRRK
jgi:NAD(P) transhydrogenase subunit alpha